MLNLFLGSVGGSIITFVLLCAWIGRGQKVDKDTVDVYKDIIRQDTADRIREMFDHGYRCATNGGRLFLMEIQKDDEPMALRFDQYMQDHHDVAMKILEKQGSFGNGGGDE